MPVTFCGIATIKQSPSLSPSLPQSLSLPLSGSCRIVWEHESRLVCSCSARRTPENKARLDGGCDITAAAEKVRASANFPRFSRGADVLQPQLNKERVSFFQKRREKKVFSHAQVVKSSRDLLYFYTVESIRHQRGHLFICFHSNFFSWRIFISLVCQALAQERTGLWTAW